MKIVSLGEAFRPFERGIFDRPGLGGITSAQFRVENLGIGVIIGGMVDTMTDPDSSDCLILDEDGNGELISARVLAPAIIYQGYSLEASIDFMENAIISLEHADILCHVVVGLTEIIGENEEAQSPDSAGGTVHYKWKLVHDNDPAREIIVLNEAVYRKMEVKFVERVDDIIAGQ